MSDRFVNGTSAEVISLTVTGCVLLLITVLVLVCLLKSRSKIRGVKAVFQPAAAFLERFFRERGPQKEREMDRVVRELSGSGDDKEFLRRYRRRKWGLVLGVLWVGSLVLLGVQLRIMITARTAPMTYVRPEYGEGDRHVRVKMILNETERVVSLIIPEKEIEMQAAESSIRGALELLQKKYGGQVVAEDIKLPENVEKVAVRWRSLTEAVMDSCGRVLMDSGQNRRPIRLLAEASLGGVSVSSVIEMELASLKDLSDRAQEDRIVAGLRDGAYTDKDKLQLPALAENGEVLTWETADHVSPWLFLALLLLLPLIALLKVNSDCKQQLSKRKSLMENEYPELIGELIILIGAGMSLSGAWHRLAEDYCDRKKLTQKSDPLYEEVVRCSIELERGSSVRQAMEGFGERIGIKQIRRFSTILIQNARRGDGFLLERLSELSQEAWDERKRMVKERSEKADLKLLLPMMILLGVVLIIVMTPALMTMQL